MSPDGNKRIRAGLQAPASVNMAPRAQPGLGTEVLGLEPGSHLEALASVLEPRHHTP